MSAAKLSLVASVKPRMSRIEVLDGWMQPVPGGRGASLSFVGLLSDGTWGNRITVEGRTAPADEPERTFANSISPRYFQVMGMQVLRGRPFSDTDRANAPPVAIVNETFARQFFNDPAPLGRRCLPSVGWPGSNCGAPGAANTRR